MKFVVKCLLFLFVGLVQILSANAAATVSALSDYFTVDTRTSYTVRFNANGDGDYPITGLMPDQNFYYDESKALRSNTFVRKGYTFGGWIKNPLNGVKDYADREVVSRLSSKDGDVIDLYALWIPIRYTVRFNANGDEDYPATGQMSDQSFYYNESKALHANSFEREGYAFGGWVKYPMAVAKAYADCEVVSKLSSENGEVVDLYALWIPKVVKIIYKPNAPPEVNIRQDSIHYYIVGKIFQLTPWCATTRDGIDFNGWYTAPSGGSRLVNGHTRVPARDTVYYGQWTVESQGGSGSGGGSGGGGYEDDDLACIVTFNPNGGSIAPEYASKSVVAGSAIGDLPTATRNGYVLEGWYTAANGGTRIAESTLVSRAMTYYAHWRDGTDSEDPPGGTVPGSGYIRNVSAKQRFPWNGLVDISFEVVGDVSSINPGVTPELEVFATNIVSGESWRPGALSWVKGDCGAEEGWHNIVWDTSVCTLDERIFDSVGNLRYQPVTYGIDNDVYSQDIVFNVSYCEGTGGVVLCAGKSPKTLIDKRVKPIVDTATIAYNSEWIGGNPNATVLITDNEAELGWFYGDGEFTWVPETSGDHELKYVTYIDGVAQDKVYTATFRSDWGSASSMFEWIVVSNEVIITKYIGDVTNVEVPPTIEGRPVTAIATDAFAGCDFVIKVTVPGSVVRIDDYAFADCISLKQVILNAGLGYIGNYAFYGCMSLAKVEIPDGLASIGKYAFGECLSLVSAEIGDGFAAIGEGAFYGCLSLKRATIGEGVSCIGDYAFYDCCSLLSMEIPNSATNIGDSAFYGCLSLKRITIGSGILGIGDSAFSECIELAKISIPESVGKLGNRAFAGCYSLVEIIFEGNAPEIGNCVFGDSDEVCDMDCTAYVHRGSTGWGVDIPGRWQGINIEYIEKEPIMWTVVFNPNGGCVGITSMQVEDWTAIGEMPVPVREGFTFIGWFDSEVGGGCVNTTTIFHGNATLYAHWEPVSGGNPGEGDDPAYYMFEWVVSNNEVTITKYIGTNSVVNIPSTIEGYPVVAIGECAFAECAFLSEVTMPDSLRIIGTEAFAFTGLVDVTIPEGVTSIGDWAFWTCSLLENATIPGTVTNIGERAFCWCESLESMIIPESVATIGDRAFAYCLSMTDILFLGNSPATGDAVFGAPDEVCDMICTAYVYRGSTGWCVDIPGMWNGIEIRYIDGAPESVYAVIEDPDGSGVYDETVGELYVRIKLSREYPDSNLYAFLVPMDEASSQFAASMVFDIGVPIMAGTAESSSSAKLSLLDGTAETRRLSYGIVLRTARTWSSGETVDTYESSDFVIRVNNVPPEIAAVEMSGSLPVTVNGGTFPGKVATGIAKVFSVEAYDVEADLASGLSSKWTFRSPNGTVTTKTAAGSISDIAVTNVFEEPGVYTCSVMLWDKDSAVGMYDFNVVVERSFADMFEWIVSDNKVTITKYIGTNTVVDIPAAIDGRLVVAIGDSAFAECEFLSQVTVPGSVTSIGDGAFAGCYSFEKIIFLGNAPEMGEYVFGEGGICGIPSTCTAYVRKDSTGWGVPIPGIWHEIPIVYQSGYEDGSDGYGSETADGYTWRYRLLVGNAGVEIVGVEPEPMGEVAIPSRLGGKTVTSVGACVFAFCQDLWWVDLPSGIRNIGDGAFYSCDELEAIFFPEALTNIGARAFAQCGYIEQAYIPFGVIGIGDEAFADCWNLKRASVPSSVSYIGRDVFSYCESLVELDLSEGLRNIGDGMFYGCCSLIAVQIPEGCQSIGSEAFAWCEKLLMVSIPGSVTQMGDLICRKGNVFEGCESLSMVVFSDRTNPLSVEPCGLPENTAVKVNRDGYGFVGWRDANAEVWGPVDDPFRMDESVTVVPIWSSVEEPGSDWVTSKSAAVSQATAEGKRILLVAGRKSSWNTMYVKNSLCMDPVFYERLKHDFVLWFCDGDNGFDEIRDYYESGFVMPLVCILDPADMGTPEGISTGWMDKEAFAKFLDANGVWAPVDDFIVPEGCNAYNDGKYVWLWEYCDGGVALVDGYTVETNEYGESYRYSCPGIYPMPIGHVDIPEFIRVPSGGIGGNGTEQVLPVVQLGDQLFYGCAGMTSVSIPDSVVAIGVDAFSNTGITSVMLPDGLQWIGSYAFFDTPLREVNVPSGLLYVNRYAFEYTPWFEKQRDFAVYGDFLLAYRGNDADVEIPGAVRVVCEDAFNSTVVESVHIPGSVEIIDDYAFYYAESLASVTGGENIQYVGYDTFGGTSLWDNSPEDAPVRAGGMIVGYKGDPSGTVEIEDGVTIIGYEMFWGCTNITAVTLPATLKHVNDGAFACCSALEDVVFEGERDNIVMNVFDAFYETPWLENKAFDPPANDNFEDAATLAGASGSVEATNAGATSETMEENLGLGSATVWWKWTAPKDGEVLFTTLGSWFDTILAVYVLEDGELREIAYNDDCDESDESDKYASLVVFQTEANATYHIVVSGYSNDKGDIILNWGMLYDSIPELPTTATEADIVAAFEGSTDTNLFANITTAADYAAYRTWAMGLSGVTVEEVKASPNAWLSFALDTDSLIAAEPEEGDLKVDGFGNAATDGAFELVASIDGISVGDGATEANLKKIFEIEGTDTINSDGTGFSSENVELSIAEPSGGKVKFTVSPKDGGKTPGSFFFKVKMK